MKTSDFLQEGPSILNQFEDDTLLQNYLKKALPADIYSKILPDLSNLGKRVATDILAMGLEAEAYPPVHIPYNPWGKRVDEIRVSRAWKDLDRTSATEGMIAIGYERKYSEFSRIYQFAKLYLFNPSSAYYTCPLAMTDGAARVLELFGTTEQKSRAFKNLTSRDPGTFWTSGQWMTEKTGGSDVSHTQTLAEYKDGHYRLYGIKWFTSSPISQMAMALARIVDEKGQSLPGSRGLSLFYLETRKESGEYNNLEVLRLKDKLGTKALPTAEIQLKGTKAELVGKIGEGVKTISHLFNITRIYNANTSVAFSRRILALARDFASKREAFGKKLISHPLHKQTLSECEHLWTGCFLFSFYATELLGKEECHKSSDTESRLLRFLTPLVKLYTAKCNMLITSELVESFGGAGYVEDVGISKWLRDAQVLTIWEGTTNVLSLDMLRAITKEGGWLAFCELMDHETTDLKSESLVKKWSKIKSEIDNILTGDAEQMEPQCRYMAFAVSEVTCHWLVEKHVKELTNSKTLDYWRQRPIRQNLI